MMHSNHFFEMPQDPRYMTNSAVGVRPQMYVPNTTVYQPDTVPPYSPGLPSEDSKTLMDLPQNGKGATMASSGNEVAIVGTGWYGRALANRLHAAGTRVLLGSRNPSSNKFKVKVPIVSIAEAIRGSRLVVLAIPADQHNSFVSTFGNQLTSNHILVDISNSKIPGAAIALQKVVRAQVVKSMNNLSAYFLEGHNQAHAPVFMSGSQEGKALLQQRVLTNLGIVGVDMGNLEASTRQESVVFRLFDKWTMPLLFAFIIFLFWFFYALIWFHLLKLQGADGSWAPYYPVRMFPLFSMNKIFGMSAITMLGCTYLPGCIAAIIQLASGTAKKPFPAILDRWMKSRKQLGLIAFWELTVHMIMSCLILSKEYLLYPMYIQTEGGVGMTALAETGLLFGVLAYATYILVACCSVPSIAAELSWREWNFVQSKLGLLGLVFGFIHLMLFNAGYSECLWCAGWEKWWSYPQKSAPPSWVAIGVPGIVILLRFVLALPGISHRLNRIRTAQ